MLYRQHAPRTHLRKSYTDMLGLPNYQRPALRSRTEEPLRLSDVQDEQNLIIPGNWISTLCSRPFLSPVRLFSLGLSSFDRCSWDQATTRRKNERMLARAYSHAKSTLAFRVQENQGAVFYDTTRISPYLWELTAE